jgi:hypothetical protein
MADTVVEALVLDLLEWVVFCWPSVAALQRQQSGTASLLRMPVPPLPQHSACFDLA